MLQLGYLTPPTLFMRKKRHQGISIRVSFQGEGHRIGIFERPGIKRMFELARNCEIDNVVRAEGLEPPRSPARS